MPPPTDANVDLLICDAVRQTQGGKLDIAGYFPVPVVKLDSSAPLPAAINLTFVFVLKDGDGQFRGALRLLDPMGKELHYVDVDEFAKVADQPHLILMQVNRIPIFVAGNYTVVLQVGDGEYRRPVRIYQ
ncbi:MAG TPA: hypothetical protein VG308_01340 [Stellaceae bacterium]|jgi:hypothetical protein|nr:hypothetical protein [Stellaceae bacterium]